MFSSLAHEEWYLGVEPICPSAFVASPAHLPLTENE